MTLSRYFLLVALVPFLFLSSGCASKNLNKRLTAVEAQIGVLTDELVRIDENLQDTRGAVQGIGPTAPSGASSGSTYRTPSGFELPSLNIQQALKSAGYYHGSVDGKIGPETRQAVQAFQRDNDLNPDGVVGRKTWEKLKVFLGGALK